MENSKQMSLPLGGGAKMLMVALPRIKLQLSKVDVTPNIPTSVGEHYKTLGAWR